jgi:hypothetical protein
VVANSTAMADEVDDQVRVPVDHVGHRMEPRF